MKKCIPENFSHEIVVNKSTFITHFFKINSPEEAENYIREIKKEYSDASHNCYCYIINPLTKVSDDGEPSGTAAMPMLNVLKHHDLDNTLCIVTRYFGGIKLGAGGLTRAYSNSVSEALLTVELLELVDGLEVEITFDIAKTNSIEHYLKKAEVKILEKSYAKFVTYTLELEKNEYDEVKNKLLEIDYSIKIVETKPIVLAQKNKNKL